MGSYSDMDIDMQYEPGAPFEDDDPFDGNETEAVSVWDTAPNTKDTGADSASPKVPQVSSIASPLNTKADDTKGTSDDEDAKRKAHEEAEAKRKSDWEAAQQAKKNAEQEQIAKLAAMSEDEIMMAATKRAGNDLEKLTRRSMKEFVTEHIQTICLEDPDFARKVMHPRKSMIHCIWYINRKAREFAEQEMKDNGFKPENGVYGCDVPDDLCYQWAEDYFNDPTAKEDEVKEEKFVAKPYTGGKSTAKPKSKAKTEVPKKESVKKPVEKVENADDAQMSLLGVAG